MKNNKMFVVLGSIGLLVTSTAKAEVNYLRIRPGIQSILLRTNVAEACHRHLAQVLTDCWAEAKSDHTEQQFKKLERCLTIGDKYYGICDDADGDGIPNDKDSARCDGDYDGDGLVDGNDPDQNGNGIVDDQDPEIKPLPWTYDSDKDGEPDYNDLNMCNPRAVRMFDDWNPSEYL